ncbi:glycosyl transferase family 2 [Anaeromyxobacter sp. K]|uniref:glycosyltransferase family 2 protein n=1 Tax=Anaeromyxobacter sp. (strain K) TaxID=447217 RepID=UPI00015F9207|nr:glycosyltransferase family 2 protein [Anaeromyxobacter sp. K]ACG75638.1 glycosyl transferase family 2 [Anaeromyxobacter sp. K]
MPPSLSVVTICLNDRAGLEATLDSVLGQTYRDLELVVVDGGSTDGSVDAIRARELRIARWVSEPDGGIYEGQGKGASLAEGEWLLFLNAGDRLGAPDALERLMTPRPVEDVVYGDVWVERGGRLRPWRAPDHPSVLHLMRSMLPHQATAFRRALFHRLGGYDLSYRIAADYDLLLRALVEARATTRHVPHLVAIHNAEGVSNDPARISRQRAERERIQEQVLPAAVREDWRVYEALESRLPGRWVKAWFRPVARPLRRLSRAVRRMPDTGGTHRPDAGKASRKG